MTKPMTRAPTVDDDETFREATAAIPGPAGSVEVFGQVRGGHAATVAVRETRPTWS